MEDMMDAKDIVGAEVKRQAEFGYEPSWEDFVIAGQQAGMKEVVEWVEKNEYYPSAELFEVIVGRKNWQAKLKEWGIE